MTGPVIRPARASDRDQWSPLFRDYATIGNVAVDDQTSDRVWEWICDSRAQTQCCVADLDGRLVGFIHYREVERPIAGDLTGYIDDLYVAPSGRGHRLGIALIEQVLAIGVQRNWSIVRWTAKETNAVANHLYRTIARRAPVNLYVADVAHRSTSSAHP